MSIKTSVPVLFAGVFVALLLATTAGAAQLSQRESSLLTAVNRARTAHDLRPLAVDRRLMRIARSHSSILLRRDAFTHGDFATRVSRSGARGPLFGENLAWGTGSRVSATSVVRSWLQSPGHRRNLLRPGFSRIGLGTATGRFAGHNGATVVTADFAGH
jgi:uncharacterized protein YkwD